MMKRKEHEKGSLEPIPLDLKKMDTVTTRSPAKRVVTHHQKEVYESRDKKLHVLLPYDMEVETLTRLPGKSLMKFLCVCKTWYSLIRSQRFVASYYAAKPSRFIVAFTNNAGGDDPKRLFILSGEEETSSSLVANLDMTIPSVTLPHGAYKYFSVHGFIACFEMSNFIICNPSTGQVLTFHCKAPATSLGYDPVDDQFKALTHVTSNYDHNPSVMVHEVITLGRGGVVSRTQLTSPPYYRVTRGRCINGFMYYGAYAPWESKTPVFVCFDVRNERILSFITTPPEVLVWRAFTSLIEYKGKPAVVVPNCLGVGGSFDRFNLWILEDVTKHEWSKQTFELPLSFPFTLGMGQRMISQGTNKAGEIIFSPTTLPGRAKPFYVFYFNPDTKSTRRVRIHGVADTEEFWSRYGLTSICCVSFSPQHNDRLSKVLSLSFAVPLVGILFEKMFGYDTKGIDPLKGPSVRVAEALSKGLLSMMAVPFGLSCLSYTPLQFYSLNFRKAEEIKPYLNGRSMYLVGMMGSGKTDSWKDNGKRALVYTFFDCDTLIEEAMNGTSVAEIFENFGESVFREKETEALKKISLMYHQVVVSKGGGAVIRPINWKYMHKGISIWLDVPRIAAVGTNSRPLLHDDESGGGPYTVALTRLSTIWEARGEAYTNASARVSLENITSKLGYRKVSDLTPTEIAIEAFELSK
ncbi:hypothetical protein HID58_040476 [Brassica napus]|uniref:shikimate kinase n=1 Tax=Brassica napus TaxID=3708 RepID=A0ABQ8B8D3_BRANA|nr:hypothetical protein HID58_040476 [Brassica napus]